MGTSTTDSLPSRLLSAFFRLGRTPWHRAPAEGLSQAETNILENIHRANRHERKLRVSDLSGILRVSSSTVTQHLNHLEGHGFVERVPSKSDKRAVNLALTEKGALALKSHWAKLEGDFAEFVAAIGEDGAERMIALIEQARKFFVGKAKEYDFFERG